MPWSSGLTSTSIPDGTVALADLANLANGTVIGRVTAGTGVPEAVATTGTGNVVRATSPTLVTPALGTPTALVLTSATGLPTAGLVDAAVTLAKQADLAQATIQGRASGAGTGVPTALTAAQVLTIVKPKFVLYQSTGATGTVTSGTPVYMTAGAATAGVGLIPEIACHMTSLEVTIGVTTLVTSGAVTLTVTVFKNANSGTSNRVFVWTQTAITNATGYGPNTTTAVVDSGMDAFNGTTDYFTIAVNVTASTSFNGPITIRLIGTPD